MADPPGSRHMSLLHRSINSGCKSASISGGKLRPLDDNTFSRSCNPSTKRNSVRLYMCIAIMRVQLTVQWYEQTSTLFSPRNGSSPVTSWKRMTPTLHKSACKVFQVEIIAWLILTSVNLKRLISIPLHHIYPLARFLGPYNMESHKKWQPNFHASEIWSEKIVFSCTLALKKKLNETKRELTMST